MYYLKVMSPKGQVAEVEVSSAAAVLGQLCGFWTAYSDGARLMCQFGRQCAQGPLWLPFWTEMPSPFRMGRSAFKQKIQTIWRELDSMAALQPIGVGDNLHKLPES